VADVLTALAAVSANTTGAALDPGGLRDEAAVEVQTTGTVTAFSVQFQQSLDKTNWANLGSAVVAVTPETVLTSVMGRYFRAVLSGYTGTGTVTAKIALGKT
jgi:hypothetical protein